ncbi:MAG TPA: hypothetical protein VFB00_01955 [Terriglobales bacterium]|nr:hypothetical protein [Terriglobales bacterium]
MMATNPKLPDYPHIPPRRPADDHAKVRMIRQSKFPWPIVALIAGAALLITIIVILPRAPQIGRSPSAGEVPQQPTAEQIQLTNEQITPAPAGDGLYFTAVLHNTGNTEITGVQVKAQFLGRNGEILSGETAAMEGVGQGGVGSQDLTQAPIKPNEERPVRIHFARTPKGWNHHLPELTITAVTGTTP